MSGFMKQISPTVMDVEDAMLLLQFARGPSDNYRGFSGPLLWIPQETVQVDRCGTGSNSAERPFQQVASVSSDKANCSSPHTLRLSQDLGQLDYLDIDEDGHIVDSQVCSDSTPHMGVLCKLILNTYFAEADDHVSRHR